MREREVAGLIAEKAQSLEDPTVERRIMLGTRITSASIFVSMNLVPALAVFT